MRGLLLIVLLAGCSRAPEVREDSPSPSPPSPEALSESGLQGRFRWVGAPSDAMKVADDAVPGCVSGRPAGALVPGPDAGLGGVVVQVVGAPGTATAPAEAIVTGTACSLVPRVSTLAAGGTLRVRNADPVLWTFHLKRLDGGQARTIQDLAVPPGHPGLSWTLREPGVYRVDSDRWGPGLGYVVVAGGGQTIVSGADGRFAAPDLPAGAWTARWWHEVAGEGEQAIEVPADGPAALYVDLPRGG